MDRSPVGGGIGQVHGAFHIWDGLMHHNLPPLPQGQPAALVDPGHSARPNKCHKCHRNVESDRLALFIPHPHPYSAPPPPLLSPSPSPQPSHPWSCVHGVDNSV